jgi:hypothetical protein
MKPSCIAQHELEIGELIAAYCAYLAGYRDKSNPAKGGTDHAEGYQVPFGVAVGHKEGIVAGRVF